MLTAHHLNESRSQRILWLLEELAVLTRLPGMSAMPGHYWPRWNGADPIRWS
jgi:hypothetical protein